MEGTERPGLNDRLKPDPATSHHPAGPFTAADLPIDGQGRIYHLQAKPGQIAPDILLVGDPGRAEFIGSQFLHDLEFEHEHRGLVTITGTSEITGEQATIISPLRASAVTSGIGTPSLEVVLGELVALNEIDFATRTLKSDFRELHILRVGTSGGLQASTELGTPIITTYAIGLDNTGLYYEAPYHDEDCERLERELGPLIRSSMSTKSRFYGKIHPYVSRAEPTLVEALVEAAELVGVPAKRGLTASVPGFFAPQGRDIARAELSVPDLDRILAEYDPRLGGQRVENMEMEASFLLHYLGGLGYRAGAVCAAVANRRNDTFAPRYQEAIKNAIQIALMALATARGRFRDGQRS